MSVGQAFALDVVYPKRNPITINSSGTFIVGSATYGVLLKINEKYIRVHPSGGFATSVSLDYGVNTFLIENGDESKILLIMRPKPKSYTASSTKSEIVEYTEKRNYYISSDNTPLRETPVNSGINRLSHFEKGVPVIVDAELNEFYRVVLNNNKKAWVAKTNVKAFEGKLDAPVKLIRSNSKKFDDYFVYTFEFDRKTPYVISEGEKLTLKFYNVKDYQDNTLVFDVPKIEKLYGYQGYYEGETFVLKVRKFPKVSENNPLKNRVITIDAGHGGRDVGAIGCLRNYEKDVNLAIAFELEKELLARGATVYMTRSDDSDVGLKERVDFVKEKDSEILISIHGNALPDGAHINQAVGTSIYYYYNQAKPLADSIMTSMTTQLGTQNDRVRQGSLALVRNTSALSILIEVAYMINPEENEKLMDAQFQKNCAKSIADGLEVFYLSDNISEP